MPLASCCRGMSCGRCEGARAHLSALVCGTAAQMRQTSSRLPSTVGSSDVSPELWRYDLESGCRGSPCTCEAVAATAASAVSRQGLQPRRLSRCTSSKEILARPWIKLWCRPDGGNARAAHQRVAPLSPPSPWRAHETGTRRTYHQLPLRVPATCLVATPWTQSASQMDFAERGLMNRRVEARQNKQSTLVNAREYA